MLLIEIKNVGKVFGEGPTHTHALRHVNLTIHKGEFVAIMGPSGSGKSTLLHILGLLERPSYGEYKFLNENIDQLTENGLANLRNKQLGFVFQAFNLLRRTSVLDNVLLPLTYTTLAKSARRKAAEQAIAQVDMTHRKSHLAHQLSGGEKQRTAIARALVNGPSLILADEPTGNLDTANGEQVLNILKQLHQQGHTVILITHELDAAHFAQRLITMRDGQIIKDEPIHQKMV